MRKEFCDVCEKEKQIYGRRQVAYFKNEQRFTEESVLCKEVDMCKECFNNFVKAEKKSVSKS